jgi:uncharacterized membrane protein
VSEVTYCPHCEAENPPGAIFCQSCKLNLHYKGPPVHAASAEELELERRSGRAAVVALICAAIIFFIGVAFLYVLFVANSTPEGGFLGAAIYGAALLVSPVILVLLVVMISSIWKSRELGKELKRLPGRARR